MILCTGNLSIRLGGNYKIQTNSPRNNGFVSFPYTESTWKCRVQRALEGLGWEKHKGIWRERWWPCNTEAARTHGCVLHNETLIFQWSLNLTCTVRINWSTRRAQVCVIKQGLQICFWRPRNTYMNTLQRHTRDTIIEDTHMCIEGHKKPSWNLADNFFPGGKLSGSATGVGVGGDEWIWPPVDPACY